MKIRSMVGLLPLVAVSVLDDDVIGRMSGFMNRLNWFTSHRKDLAGQIAYLARREGGEKKNLRLLAVPCRGRLERVLRTMLDENEFLSPYGIRSLSKHHAEHPFVLDTGDGRHQVDYEPGESCTEMFGGNSNWRGPVWVPVNWLLIEALHRYHDFYGDELTVECPTGSGQRMNLGQVAEELRRRLAGLFRPNGQGLCPWQGDMEIFRDDPAWRELTLFHEYYHGDTGRGCGASHQTGWTALIADMLTGKRPRPMATR